jgi:hypothetical protein
MTGPTRHDHHQQPTENPFQAQPTTMAARLELAAPVTGVDGPPTGSGLRLVHRDGRPFTAEETDPRWRRPGAGHRASLGSWPISRGLPSMRCPWIASSPRPGGTERPVLAAVSPKSLFCAGQLVRAASVLAAVACGAWCFSGGWYGCARRAVTAVSGTSRNATTMPRSPFSMTLNSPSGHNYCGPGHRTTPRTRRRL